MEKIVSVEEYKELLKKKKKSKYNAVRVKRNGWTYPSKKQAKRYDELKMLQEAGEVKYFLEEIPMRLPGKTRYYADFQIFWKDGSVTYEDVKGIDTPVSSLKRKIVEDIYPVKIEII